jgi:hypothetical protein
MNFDTIITVSGWEERFKLSIERFLIKNTACQIIFLDYEEYFTETEKNKNELISIIESNGIKHNTEILKQNDNITNWKVVKNVINNISGSLIIDMTTMPRDIIYFSLYHAEKAENIKELYCLYNSPERYSQEKWLTRDPRKPQLVYNMSGLSEIGKDTILILITGYDRKRVEQILNYYEPRKVYLGLQTGEQYDNTILNVSKYIDFNKASDNIEIFDINAFAIGDYGFSKIEEIIQNNMDSNIITASLGPKPSSIALFRLNKKYPKVGLIYVPVNTFNMNYSSGIDSKDAILERIK